MPTSYRSYDKVRPEPPFLPYAERGFSQWLAFDIEPPTGAGYRTVAGELGPHLSRALRGALLMHAEEQVKPLLSGHAAADGRALATPHVGYLALPFVGGEHADGSVKGMAIALPWGHTLVDRQGIARALLAWERSRGGEDGYPVSLPLHLGRLGVVHVRRSEAGGQHWSQSFQRWSQPARTWATATPIALDRMPRDLGARDAARAEQAHQHARATVASACQNIGLPAPNTEDIRIAPSAAVRGATPARAYGRFEHGGRVRFLVHAVLRFPTPVSGPLVLGAGRYLGLGLLAPLPELERATRRETQS